MTHIFHAHTHTHSLSLSLLHFVVWFLAKNPVHVLKLLLALQKDRIWNRQREKYQRERVWFWSGKYVREREAERESERDGRCAVCRRKCGWRFQICRQIRDTESILDSYRHVEQGTDGDWVLQGFSKNIHSTSTDFSSSLLFFYSILLFPIYLSSPVTVLVLYTCVHIVHRSLYTRMQMQTYNTMQCSSYYCRYHPCFRAET